MTPELETLRRLHEAATPGPWGSFTMLSKPTHSFIEAPWDIIAEECATSDAHLIVTLRNLAPELIALLEAVEVLCNPPKDCPATCLDQMAVVRDCNEWLRAKLREVKP